jgi:uncharacterized protein (TIGR02466 family)
MKNYIQKLWQDRSNNQNWQTEPDLHTKVEFKIFADMVLDTSKEILETLDYAVEDIAITDMWGNVLRKGEVHPPHTHSNNFLSGVYYLYSDKAAGIQFFDPRPSSDVMVPKKTNKTHNNSNLLSFASKTNRAVFFPSWLQHWVPQNISEKNRISIAWNVQLKGEVGEHHEYQSATF